MHRPIKFSLLILALLCATPAVHAGFLVKKTATAVIDNCPGQSNLVHTVSAPQSTSYSQGDVHDRPRHKRKPSASGWEGIVALVCGLTFNPLLAIIFGAIGMGPGHKHKDLATAGFIIGLVEVFLVLAITVLLVISWGM